MKPLHLVIACGGTGGHFYPTLAIAEAWRRRGHQVSLLISGKHAESQLQEAANRQIPAVELPIAATRPLLCFPWRFLKAFLAAQRELKRMKPDLILGMGSYASPPACLAGILAIRRIHRLPLFLHEGNAFMGKANRLLAKMGRWLGVLKGVGLSLELCPQGGGRENYPSRLVGMPLREALVKSALAPSSAEDKKNYLEALGLAADDSKKTILVFGGSQGARWINQLFLDMAPLLAKHELQNKLQFVFLTGTDENQPLIQAYQQAGISASVRRAETEMGRCYPAVDFVICRGGASSLCELALFKRPALLIPLPSAADDHQSCNARLAASLGGVFHSSQAELTAEKLCQLLMELLQNPEKSGQMGEALHLLARPHAAEDMAQYMEEGMCP